jgi:uncharacterized protein YecE (DUF72 family)
MEALIGTSGYDYPEWKGIFYPEDLKRKDFLSYYASQFNALEINNTFYNMPTANRLLSFWERSEGRLQFSVKANRMLTHEVGSAWELDAALFLHAVSSLAEKSSLCAVLFQFPQSFHYTPENRRYLAKLIDVFSSLPLVIEFRHVEWIRESVLEGLQSRGVGLCYCDMPELKYLPNNATSAVPEPVEGQPLPTSFYLRLHGRNADAWYAVDNSQNGSSRYTYDYTDQELSEFVPVIQNVILTGRQPIVFFNNHPNGSGAKNAVKFKDLLK